MACVYVIVNPKTLERIKTFKTNYIDSKVLKKKKNFLKLFW